MTRVLVLLLLCSSMCLADDEIPVVRNGSDLADACSKMDHVSATDPWPSALPVSQRAYVLAFSWHVRSTISRGSREAFVASTTGKLSRGQTWSLIEPELARVFRDSESVSRALRLLVNTAEAVATPAQSRRRTPKKRLQRAP